jgi:hypothetical protein
MRAAGAGVVYLGSSSSLSCVVGRIPAETAVASPYVGFVVPSTLPRLRLTSSIHLPWVDCRSGVNPSDIDVIMGRLPRVMRCEREHTEDEPPVSRHVFPGPGPLTARHNTHVCGRRHCPCALLLWLQRGLATLLPAGPVPAACARGSCADCACGFCARCAC